jgi:hypothetical protein
MKGIPVLLAVGSLCISAAHAATVTLTREDVDSAQDIEAAINAATHFGTTPGKVILDGRKGGFTYTGSDRTINLGVSNLALVGVNGATIENCNGGGAIQFDPLPVRNVLIENLTFNCASGGIFVTDPSRRENITIRDNVFNTQGAAIFLLNLVDGKIFNNTIDAGGTEVAAIFLNGARNSEIVGNRITDADAGIHLGTEADLDSTGNRVIANRISDAVVGIQLQGNAARNAILLNRISLSAAGHTGISLGDGTHNNRVHFNQVSSEVGGPFATVDDQGTDNNVSFNRP